MIIEQAFFALPELLLGNFYAVQDYEAGIVGIFSMAILQELNGRNINHPIRHLQTERRYNPNLPRRADLYVNSRQLMVTNRRLGNVAVHSGVDSVCTVEFARTATFTNG